MPGGGDDAKLDAKEKAIEQKAEQHLKEQLKSDLSPAIWQKYDQLGGKTVFGKQTSDLLVIGADAGVAARFQHGSIDAVKKNGAKVAYGVIGSFYEKWKKLGLEGYGIPTSDASATAVDTHQWFSGGLLVEKNGTTTPFEVHGPILDKYKKLKHGKQTDTTRQSTLTEARC